MCFALRNKFSAIAFVAAVAPAMLAQSAFADGAFVTQAARGSFAAHPMITNPVTAPSSPSFTPSRGGTTQATPETTVPATGGNFAGTLEMGHNNVVSQNQSGSGNFSNVGILGGAFDNVGVSQRGQGLYSNLYLVGIKGLNVDVVQTPGAPPVDLLIGRLPNGTVGFFQPQGAPPVPMFRVGNVLVVR
jgi:hypothetical protein